MSANPIATWQIPRRLSGGLREAASQMPCVVLQGPRQSGKTTLARATFPGYRYETLENPGVRRFATDDPKAFLEQFSAVPGVILDEIQRVPELFSWLQGIVDDDPRPGRFILTGSENYLLTHRVGQSLAGRVRLLRLLPFGLDELPEPLREWDLDRAIWRGQFPRVVAGGVPPEDWLPDYMETYLERDVRSLREIGDLASFHRFLTMCASRTGQILNMQALAADCGISGPTAKSWLSVLEAGFAIFLLRPWHVNYGKRLVKSPKLYFWDTGLACSLLGLRTPQAVAGNAIRGALFETFMISEIHKSILHAGRHADLHYWRDSQGHELDLLIPDGAGGHRAVEIKSGSTLQPGWFDGLSRWNALTGSDPATNLLIHGGDGQERRSKGEVVGWTCMAEWLGSMT